MKPFIKWAGGKTQLLDTIEANLPHDINNITRYVEPFVGAGAVFFYLIEHDYFQEYIINDINPKLINVYRVIRDNVEQLIRELTYMRDIYFELAVQEQKEAYYYRIREEFNASNVLNIEQAAKFIFLNKTCYNGLYRENSRGGFNVPFGKHTTPSMFDEEQLREISRLLSLTNEQGELRVQIYNTNYENLGELIDANTFVYFDPPYRPVTVGGFNSYNKSSFNDEEQIELSNFYRELNHINARLMLSNSDPRILDPQDNFFDDLYNGFNIQRVMATRAINRNGAGRGAVTELLITNY